ncbi:MAG TPA: ComF family protein [Thiobacillaceae bacterium]|nr:ComF family protein [Thiobacillaceae bacterium]HNU64825.1 ComF family protein [Thiobacillaceae bacterium]
MRLPHACRLCGERVLAGVLCPGCHLDLPRLSGACCPRCALPSPDGQTCGACLRRPPAFDQAQAAHAYAFPLDALIRHCKYQGVLELTELFARELATRVRFQDRPDLLIPMPLHPRRLGERGYNQAAEITRRLARHLALPWQADACRRARDTPPQAGLDLQARRRNLRGAFRCERALSGRHVALVDDVMTSGASLQELAKAVKMAGAARVSVWVVARAL